MAEFFPNEAAVCLVLSSTLLVKAQSVRRYDIAGNSACLGERKSLKCKLTKWRRIRTFAREAFINF